MQIADFKLPFDINYYQTHPLSEKNQFKISDDYNENELEFEIEDTTTQNNPFNNIYDNN